MDDKAPIVPGWVYFILAATAAMLSFHLNVRQCLNLPAYSPSDDTAYFQSESAFQYRYARLLAAGETVPVIDTRAQYPEGVKVGRELSLWMERATAAASRLLYEKPPAPYHTFVIFWVCAVSALSVLSCYLLGLALLGSAPAALAAALLFGVCWIGSSLTAQAYGFQAFALPLLFFATAAFAAALNKERAHPAGWLAAGAAAFAIALVSWHFARFFLIAFWLALAYAAWRGRADDALLKRLRLCAGVLLAACAAAGLGFPVLRDTLFIASPAFLAGCALLAALSLRGWRLAAALAALLAAAFWQTGREAAGYGHVYALLWDKLRFALAKPADPLKLSQQARLLWTGPFNSPQAGFLVFSLLPLALAAAPRAWRAVKGPAVKDPAGALCDALLLLFAAGTVLVERLAPILAFFLCAASLRRGGRPGKIWLTAGLAGLALLEGLKTAAPQSPLNLVMPLAASFRPAEAQPKPSLENQRAALKWLDRQAAGSPVAADFGLSASVLAYTRSPVLLHPKFESPVIRAKTAEYLAALYSDEGAFLAFCRKYGARYFLYGAAGITDGTKDGARYMAGIRALTGDMAAVRFQFFPAKLKDFKLVYENGDYRIFEVAANRAGKPAGPAAPIYDLANFAPRQEKDGTLTLDTADVLKRRVDSSRSLYLARLYLSRGRPQQALQAYEAAFAAWPPDDKINEDYLNLKAALNQTKPRLH
ncbi:MAG TPA: hypothetical protein DCZ92_03650 [Elusimicrobia bacterium]|nr:MAG: hypothetical protein A2016_01455 [Elusimicrobia bacterium GWF2_62_30]HBA59913.1 hypothetical protein [Elusimicrobiota bacterium]